MIEQKETQFCIYNAERRFPRYGKSPFCIILIVKMSGSVALRTEFADCLAGLPEFAFTHFLELGIELCTIVWLAV